MKMGGRSAIGGDSEFTPRLNDVRTTNCEFTDELFAQTKHGLIATGANTSVRCSKQHISQFKEQLKKIHGMIELAEDQDDELLDNVMWGSKLTVDAFLDKTIGAKLVRILKKINLPLEARQIFKIYSLCVELNECTENFVRGYIYCLTTNAHIAEKKLVHSASALDKISKDLVESIKMLKRNSEKMMKVVQESQITKISSVPSGPLTSPVLIGSGIKKRKSSELSVPKTDVSGTLEERMKKFIDAKLKWFNLSYDAISAYLPDLNLKDVFTYLMHRPHAKDLFIANMGGHENVLKNLKSDFVRISTAARSGQVVVATRKGKGKV